MNITAQAKQWLFNLSGNIHLRRKKIKHLLLQRFRYSAGESILRNRYLSIFARDLNTRDPQLFSEKLFCKMIAINRQNDPVLTRLADKHLAREWVESRIGPEYLVPMLWQGNNPRHIPFDQLPERCVIKTNNGSNRIIIKNGPLDQDKVCSQLSIWLQGNYYWVAREHQYYEIPPTVIVEKFLAEETTDGPLDYRFWCFNGKPAIIQVDNHSHSINPFYDLEWNLLDLKTRKNVESTTAMRPTNLEKMIELAGKLSSGFDFVRVDLYNIKGQILFGEMTFTPRAGDSKFEPSSWDLELGSLWQVDPRYQLN